MRTKITNRKPRWGEERIVKRFAWLPTVVLHPPTYTYYRIWFEWYYEEQMYSSNTQGNFWKTMKKRLDL